MNSQINNLTEEHHLFHAVGEYIPGGSFNGLQTYSFAGPGTKFVQRYREGYRGVNDLDHACMYHDYWYYLFKDAEKRNESDVALARACDRIIADPNTDEQQKTDARFVKYVMTTKAVFEI
jgi:hypothetical protein